MYVVSELCLFPGVVFFLIYLWLPELCQGSWLLKQAYDFIFFGHFELFRCYKQQNTLTERYIKSLKLLNLRQALSL